MVHWDMVPKSGKEALQLLDRDEARGVVVHEAEDLVGSIDLLLINILSV